MKRDQQDKVLSGAIEAAHAAGKVLLQYFRTQLQVKEKADGGLVTQADLESERTALLILKHAFPDFGVLTEESLEEKTTSPGRWILDPLDGTTNYLHGLPNFCVSIAAEWKGEILVGVVYHPLPGDTYTAIRGRGAFVNSEPIHVSSTFELRDSFLSTGFSSQTGKYLTEEIVAFERLSRRVSGIRRPGSAALDLACVARGIFDGFWERGLSAWDVAAGKLLVEEAGGKVTDFQGRPNCMESGELLSSNGRLHEILLCESSLGSR